jgi:uncharacterized protein YkwD
MQGLFAEPRRVIACLLVAMGALWSAPAFAETVRVVNDKGRGQAQVQLNPTSGPLTNANAEASLSAAAGSTASGQISRVLHPICPATSPPPPAPSYSFSFQATGGTATLTIPSITPDAFNEARSTEETTLIGLVNDERARNRTDAGDFNHPAVPPVTDVVPLDRAADSQSAWVQLDPATHFSHCGRNGYGMGLRSQDAGYTGALNGTGEVLVKGLNITAQQAFNSWRTSLSHWKILMSSSMTVMGVGMTKDVATIVTGASCAGGLPSCETPLYGVPGGGGGGTGGGGTGGGGDTGGGGTGGGGDTGGGGTGGGGDTGGGGTGGGGDTGGGGTGGGGDTSGGGSGTGGDGSTSGTGSTQNPTPTAEGTTTIDPVLDAITPDVTTVREPLAHFVRGALLRATRALLTVDWRAGVLAAHYDLERSASGGAFAPLSVAPLSASSNRRLHAFGVPYRFRVRPTTSSGQLGEWITGPVVTPRLLSALADGATYTGTWTSPSAQAAVAKGMVTRDPAAAVTLRFTGRAVGWAARGGKGTGTVLVTLDGARAARVALAKARDRKARVVFTRAFRTSGSHTLTIRPLSRNGRPIDVRAFLVLR